MCIAAYEIGISNISLRLCFGTPVFLLFKELQLLVLFDRWTSCQSTCADHKSWSNFASSASSTLLLILARNPTPWFPISLKTKARRSGPCSLVASLIFCLLILTVPQWAWIVLWKSLLQSHCKEASFSHSCICHTCLQWLSLPCFLLRHVCAEHYFLNYVCIRIHPLKAGISLL